MPKVIIICAALTCLLDVHRRSTACPSFTSHPLFFILSQGHFLEGIMVFCHPYQRTTPTSWAIGSNAFPNAKSIRSHHFSLIGVSHTINSTIPCCATNPPRLHPLLRDLRKAALHEILDYVFVSKKISKPILDPACLIPCPKGGFFRSPPKTHPSCSVSTWVQYTVLSSALYFERLHPVYSESIQYFIFTKTTIIAM